MLIRWSSFSLHFLSPPGIALAGQSPQPERAGWKSLGHPVTHPFWQEVLGHELNAPQPHRCHKSPQNSCTAERTSCTYAHPSAFLQGLDTCGSSLNAPKAPYQDVHQDHTFGSFLTEESWSPVHWGHFPLKDAVILRQVSFHLSFPVSTLQLYKANKWWIELPRLVKTALFSRQHCALAITVVQSCTCTQTWLATISKITYQQA